VPFSVWSGTPDNAADDAAVFFTNQIMVERFSFLPNPNPPRALVEIFRKRLATGRRAPWS